MGALLGSMLLLLAVVYAIANALGAFIGFWVFVSRRVRNYRENRRARFSGKGKTRSGQAR